MSPALLLLLPLMQGLVPGARGFSLCGWRTQYAGGGVLRYRGGFGADVISVENTLEALIVRGPFLPSTNITLQDLPGKYVFCVRWFPGLRIFNLTYGLQNYTWEARDTARGGRDPAGESADSVCHNETLIINMTLNGINMSSSCRFDVRPRDWLNDTRFVDREISMLGRLLDRAGAVGSGPGLRRWIDAALSQVRFDGESHRFGKGSIEAAVFTLGSVDALSSIPKDMGVSVSLPKELLPEKGLLPKRLHVVRVRGSSLFQDAANSTMLGEHVIGISVEKTQISNLREDVVLFFQHPPVQANFSPVCVFWNESASGWSTYGCRTIPAGIQTQCRCNHLTYFALLMRIAEPVISEAHLVSLTAVTFAGCTISALAALFTICWSCFSRAAHSNPTLQIHMHLLAAVFLLDVSFMVSAVLGAADLPLLCKSSAILLHSAQLCTFTWMAIEGFNLYRLVVKVFNSSFLTTGKLAVVGWGTPLLIVLVIALMNSDSYGSLSINVDRPSGSSAALCWLTEPIIHHVLNVGLFGFVLLLNTGMLVAMTRCVLRLAPHTRGEKVRHCVTLLGLSCMLGLPWGLAFFSFGVLYLPVQYAFSILNSLQGFFIFLWYWALSQPHGKDASRSSYSTGTTPASPRPDQSVIMSDHKKLLS
ncbi:adhesion G-protein coupled receptor G1-like [Spea bombifrons]|uniref:adhesion G-protein coupled receptor G1-like n=1 Tax=Spea bombifrons TaxID=233779 RepID=UPI00234BFBDF|nr:adhesion G-protein coupled receptor G1-like [Spea bombifrons]